MKFVDRSIFVVEAGFVFLCERAARDNADWHLEGASVIRRWGTTKGLGEIAASGPTVDTVLDPCGNPAVPIGKVLVRIPCTY